jgi:hypothetical protein
MDAVDDYCLLVFFSEKGICAYSAGSGLVMGDMVERASATRLTIFTC